MTACVNCHWNADDVQCREFHIPLPGESDPRSQNSLAKTVLDLINPAMSPLHLLSRGEGSHQGLHSR